MTDPAKVAAATIRANVQAGIELAATGYTPEALESMALETIRAALREHAPADVADALHTFPFWEEWGDKLSVDDRFAMHDAITAPSPPSSPATRRRCGSAWPS
jgi:hypothetical protein